nr:hypothetical protein [uncultured Undibacterium sp.]
MKFNSKDIVIDADIARSSGVTEHPISRNSRVVLQAIINSDLKVVFCSALLDEWKKHKSRFATQWLSSMVAKKRFIIVSPPMITRNEIDNAQIKEDMRDIARKDAHIIDIAISCSKLIASNDSTARNVFCEIALNSKIFDDLFWIVPRDDADLFEKTILERDYMKLHWMLNNHPSKGAGLSRV